MSKKKNNTEMEENAAVKEKEIKNEAAQENAEQQEVQPEEQSEDVSIEAQLIEKVNEYQNKYLRLSAEFDNYRKRTLKEKMELTKTAGEDIFVGILPIIDDFERALGSMTDAKEIDAIKDGINLIYSKFVKFLNQKGVKEIEARDKDFDTDFHEALTKIPVEKKKQKGKVMDVVEKGYMLDEKVIRYAKVVVGE